MLRSFQLSEVIRSSCVLPACTECPFVWVGSGGCDGARQAGAVPPHPAGLYCPAGHDLRAPLEPAVTTPQQGRTLCNCCHQLLAQML